ncbi:MAG: DUF364 domain-containing protein [Pseudomonadota bacterium]
MYKILKEKFRTIVNEHNWSTEEITVVAQTLSPEEAIGNPEEDDYPLLKGRERIMEARFREARGHAFTDMFGNYRGTIDEILGMEMKNNFRRAVFVSTLNAVLRHLGMVEGTVHCKDRAPQECSQVLVKKIRSEFGNPRVLLVGFQPRMAEALAQGFALRITDMDEANIGTKRFGVMIQSPKETQENIGWCDLMVITGSTAVNNTMKEFIGKKPVLFYGVTVAGAASLLGLNRFCPLGK